MWCRFGGDGVGVYVVGSALRPGRPRDLDIVIVLPDSHFRLRYGEHDKDWAPDMAEEWSPGRRKWAREVGGLVPHLCAVLGHAWPPDLKVQSALMSAATGGERRRLDDFAEFDGHEKTMIREARLHNEAVQALQDAGYKVTYGDQSKAYLPDGTLLGEFSYDGAWKACLRHALHLKIGHQ